MMTQQQKNNALMLKMDQERETRRKLAIEMLDALNESKNK